MGEILQYLLTGLSLGGTRDTDREEETENHHRHPGSETHGALQLPWAKQPLRARPGGACFRVGQARFRPQDRAAWDLLPIRSPEGPFP